MEKNCSSIGSCSLMHFSFRNRQIKNRFGFLNIGEYVMKRKRAGLGGPVMALRDASPQAMHHFTRFDQVRAERPRASVRCPVSRPYPTGAAGSIRSFWSASTRACENLPLSNLSRFGQKTRAREGIEKTYENQISRQPTRVTETLPSTIWITPRRSAKAIRLSSIATRSAVQPRREGEVRVIGRLTLGLDYEATAEYP